MIRRELRIKLADLNSTQLPNPPLIFYMGGKIEGGELIVFFYS
jgi:hypothetical protein